MSLTDVFPDLIGSAAAISALDEPHQFGAANVRIDFSGRGELRANYWRLLQDGKEVVSSFDHRQKYGLPGALDAVQKLQTELLGKVVTVGKVDTGTADLVFEFGGGIKLQIFGFSAYEVWQIIFPNGAVEYSNFVKQQALR